MNVNLFTTNDYENETAFRPQKNKPKQTQFFCPQTSALAHKKAEKYEKLVRIA